MVHLCVLNLCTIFLLSWEVLQVFYCLCQQAGCLPDYQSSLPSFTRGHDSIVCCTSLCEPLYSFLFNISWCHTFSNTCDESYIAHSPSSCYSSWCTPGYTWYLLPAQNTCSMSSPSLPWWSGLQLAAFFPSSPNSAQLSWVKPQTCWCQHPPTHMALPRAVHYYPDEVTYCF